MLQQEEKPTENQLRRSQGAAVHGRVQSATVTVNLHNE